MKKPAPLGRPIVDIFEPPGPKAESWLATTAPMAFLIGPVGGGKTTAACQKCFETVRRQNRSTVDGMRKARVICVRPNYRHMWKTVIPSWRKFWGHHGTFEGIKDGPASHILQFRNGPNGKPDMRLEVLFAAFGDEDIEEFCRGFETTAWWLNESDTLPPDCLGWFEQRAGQRAFMDEMPDPDVVPPPQYTRIFGDLNMPDEDNWFYNDIYLDPPEGCEIYVQASGFSPDHENQKILRRESPTYYRDKAKAMPAWQVRRMIECKVGLSREGEPVYTDYNDELHRASSAMEPEPGMPLVIGADQGLRPAAIIGQKDSEGFLRILNEFGVPEGEVVGAVDFGERVGEYIAEHYAAWCRRGGVEIVADPAAAARSAIGIGKESDERTWLKEFARGVMKHVGSVKFRVAPGNNVIEKRLSAVTGWLKKQVRGEPAFRLHQRCLHLRRGFVSGYRVTRKKGRAGEFQDKPEKNMYADYHDALQYLCLVLLPGADVEAGRDFSFNPAAMARHAAKAVRQVKVIH